MIILFPLWWLGWHNTSQIKGIVMLDMLVNSLITHFFYIFKLFIKWLMGGSPLLSCCSLLWALSCLTCVA